MSEAPSPLELLFGMRSGQQETPTPRPVMEAQRLDLLSRFKDYQKSCHLSPGDLVAEKDGLGISNGKARQNIALMLWRILDPLDASDAALIKDWVAGHKHFDRIDCLVAFVGDEEGVLIFRPACLQHLRPLNAEELSALADVVTKGASSPKEVAA